MLKHKWQFQYQTLNERWRDFKGDSWRSTIIEQRQRLAILLRKSSGLKSALDDTIADAYPDAAVLAHKETCLPLTSFPTVCPYLTEQLLDDAFYPDSTPVNNCVDP